MLIASVCRPRRAPPPDAGPSGWADGAVLQGPRDVCHARVQKEHNDRDSAEQAADDDGMSLLPQDSACRVLVFVVLELILVLTGGAAHGDHGPAMALPSWPAHHASPVGYRGYGVGP